ncbi:MAG TPA: carboxypeptidase-like regulatory domain-containing protein [Pyrinomonadaceae bacterium]|nr:carboxypeptidase-like regulatory domain-containing protein [Pyrinomonadaceae bacterium]
MIKRFTFSMLALCLFAVAALAQTNTGNLTGTVSDPSGNIQGATVVITDDKTGKEKTVITNDSGGFSVNQLDTGLYTVKVTSAGHKTFTATAVKIDVGVTYTLNATLEVGNIAENVTVVAGVDIINSADAQLNNTVSQRQILELPLNGRNPLTLVLLQPGTSANGNNTTSINGQRSSFTNITRDGINVQDNFIRSNAVDFIPDRPNVDDTGEFTIVTQNAGAELGYGASQVQLVTPRGSNDFHGAVYEYNRNSKFAANSFFNNFSSVKRPFLNRNQFGGKGSGRILKDKLFFYGGFEDFILRQSTTVNRTILLPSARNGVFTFRDTTGVTRTVNLLTAPFSTVTGVTAIDGTINSRILANLPTAGNNTTLGDQLNTTGLTFSRATNTDRKAFTSRIDYIINGKNSVNGIVEYKSENNLRNDVDAQQGGTACCYSTIPLGFQPAHTPFLSLAWHWTPSANLTNELNGGWQKSDPTFGNTQPVPAFYIQIPLINNPESGFDAQGRTTNIYSVQDNAVWTHGKHSLRFGGQYQKFTITPFGPGAFGQSFIPTDVIGGGTTPGFTTGNTGNFNVAAGCVAATGVNCASNTQIATATSLIALLGGLVGGANQTFTVASKTGTLAPAPPLRHLLYSDWSGYAADQFRASPHLTLNFGLRYDLFLPIRERDGLLLEPVFGGDARSAILNPNGTYDFLGVNGHGNNFFGTDKNNFAPVLSFAWSPTFKNHFLNMVAPGEGKTVLRGGYRRSFVNDEWTRAADNALLGNAGLTSQLTTTGNFRLTAPPSFAAPAVVVPRTYAQNNALASGFGTVFAINPNLKVPSTDEFNIGIEREIGWQTALEVRFVHGQSNTLIRGLDLNQINIFAPGFFQDFQSAHANSVAGFTNPNCTAGSLSPTGVACRPLTLMSQAQFFPGSVFTNATILNNIRNGNTADFALNVIGGSVFIIPAYGQLLLPNPNTGVVDFLTNSAKYRYNSLQVEMRRRFSKGLTFQANYTFQRNLTDAPGTNQTNFEPLIDNACPSCEYAVADFDTTHVFNFNTIYELPFGKGKSFIGNAGPWLDRLVGGWQVTSIMRLDSEAPFSIADPRGTLNRAGRSGRQTANTNLTANQVRDLVGVFKTPCGVYFINPSVINLDMAQCNLGLVRPRLAGTTAGVAALGFDQPTFPGQVFFNVAPGQRGNMPINFLHGPWYFDWDASIIKNIRITEKTKLQLRAESFNTLNQARFQLPTQFNNINSSTFGRTTSTFPASRVIQFVGRFEF